MTEIRPDLVTIIDYNFFFNFHGDAVQDYIFFFLGVYVSSLIFFASRQNFNVLNFNKVIKSMKTFLLLKTFSTFKIILLND